jgi:predicted nucleic acid-binding protein
VKLLDANALLYAYDARSAHHEVCREWLTGVLNDDEPVGLPWQTLLAFVRIATNSLAALAQEQGATLCSTDRDFLGFTTLKRLDPTQ